MSARVFNPVIMSEMRRMIRGAAGGSGVAYSENGSQSSIPIVERSRSLDVARVRRDLFGPVDHEDCRKFVEEELSAQQERDSERWGFDFKRGMPKKSGPGSSRYIWEKVNPREKIPEPYALRRMQYLSRCVADDAPTPATTASEVVEANSATQECSATTTASTPNNTQMRITDFLKKRKRTLATLKPISTAATEPKKARLSNSNS